MKKVLYLILLLTLCQVEQINAHKFEKTSLGGIYEVNGVDIEVQFYTLLIVRITKAPKGRAYEKKSLSVIANPQQVIPTSHKSGKNIRLESNQLHIIIDQCLGVVSFYTEKGKKLLLEKSAAVFTDFNDVSMKTFSVYQPFILETGEAIYELGQLQNGGMSQRGATKRFIQGNTEDVIAFFQLVKGYGVFQDNYSPTTFTDNAQETSLNSEVDGLVDYYSMYGGNTDGVVAQMRKLTGEVPIFPLWAYGFFQSRECYRSQHEVVRVARKYHELGIPLDGIIQDRQYWGSNYLWNTMELLSEEFPNPKQMMNDIHSMYTRMVISIWSSFDPMTK